MASAVVSKPGISWGRYALFAAIAAVGAAMVNAIIYLIASGLGAMPETVLIQPANLPITLFPVISASVMGAIAGALTYAALLRWTRRPARIFTIMAVVVLVLGVGPTLTLPGAPAAMVVALNVMHVAAAVVIVGVLTRIRR